MQQQHFITRSKQLSLQSHELLPTLNPLEPISLSSTTIGDVELATSKLTKVGPGIIATILPTHVLLIKGHNGAEQTIIPVPSAHDIVLSLSGLFLAIYKKPANNATQQDFNVSIWNTKTLLECTSFPHKSQNTWIPQWSSDESVMVRMSPTSHNILFYKDEGRTEFYKISLPNIASFSLSPPQRAPTDSSTIEDKVAIFVKESNNMPASVKIYLLSSLDTVHRQKSFFKADKCVMKWSPSTSHLLVESQTEIDSTGHSYYGETSLYFIRIIDETDLKVPLDQEGPIHDFEWSPTEDTFIVCYGYMPSKAMQFNSLCLPLYQYPISSKNHIRHNPQGSLVSFGAFGNLPGHVEVWTTSPRSAPKAPPRRVGHFQSQGSSVLEWSPCGRYMLTGILTPRLRVDNGWKMWAWNGSLLLKEDHDELYQIIWDPSSGGGFGAAGNADDDYEAFLKELNTGGPRSIIPGSPDLPSTSDSGSAPLVKAVYRPPGLRRNFDLSGGSSASLSKQAPPPPPQRSVAIAMPASTLTKEEKKVKKLTEKYESILALQARHNGGEELELNQLEKLSRLSQVREDLLKAQKELKGN